MYETLAAGATAAKGGGVGSYYLINCIDGVQPPAILHAILANSSSAESVSLVYFNIGGGIVMVLLCGGKLVAIVFLIKITQYCCPSPSREEMRL